MTLARKSGSIAVAVGMLVTCFVISAGQAPEVSAGGTPIQSVAPVRLADTRPGEKTIDGQFAGAGRRGADSRTEIQIAGRGNVPLGATAALINLTDVQPSDGNYLTVYPCTPTRPDASNLNTPAFDIRANNVFVKLSDTGKVCVYTVRDTNFIIDINGFVPAGGSTNSVNPVRLFDSRPGEKTVDGQFAGIGKRGPESVTKVQIAGRGGVPADATAAIINLTDVLPADGNLLTVYPCTPTRPDASSVNTPVNDIRANNMYVKLSADGAVCVYTVRDTNFLIDVNGYVPAGGTPNTVNPVRLFDSRPGEKTIDGQYAGRGNVGPDSKTEIQVAGRGGVPADATAAIINLTSIFPRVGNYLTAYPCGARPDASTVNSPTGDIRANSTFVKLSPTGTVCIYSVYATDFVIDINGYVTPPAATPPTTAATTTTTVVRQTLQVLSADCETWEKPLTSVTYDDTSLDGKATLTTTHFNVVGGSPPYTFESPDLVAYTLDRRTGVLTRNGGSNGRTDFTLVIADSAGQKLALPATANWKPAVLFGFDYRSYLPNGQFIRLPQIKNWGVAPYTYSLAGLSGYGIDRSTGALSYVNATQDDLNGSILVTDKTGKVLVLDAYVYRRNSWSILVASGQKLIVGQSLGVFDPNGWGRGPYSYALTGPPGYRVNEAGMLILNDRAEVDWLNKILQDPNGGTFLNFDLAVKDSNGMVMMERVKVTIGTGGIATTC